MLPMLSKVANKPQEYKKRRGHSERNVPKGESKFEIRLIKTEEL